MTTDLNAEQLARLARLSKRNPAQAAPASAPAVAAPTSAVPPPPPPLGGVNPPPSSVTAVPPPPRTIIPPPPAATGLAASAAPSDLTDLQLARVAKLGKRNPSGAAATSGAARSAATVQAPVGSAWSPPVGGPGPAPAITVEPAAAAMVAVVDRQTSVRLFGGRRRHVAAAGRILATGLATSGFLATIASLATADARQLEAKQADAAPPTTLLETIHRVVYVDEFGNPIAPPTTLAALDPTAATTTIAAVVDANAIVDPLAPTTTLAAAVTPLDAATASVPAIGGTSTPGPAPAPGAPAPAP
ncbi:MAG: hypothetical protein ABI949_10320, partial [Ilumatobacteraceae bacterium]